MSSEYSLSRVTANDFLAAPIGHCIPLGRATCIVYGLSTAATALLFFFRIQAVFASQRWVVYSFFALWVAVSGLYMGATFAVGAAPLGPTKYCLTFGIKSWAFIGGSSLAFHDTMPECQRPLDSEFSPAAE